MTVLALDPTTGGVDVGAHLALAPRPKSLEGQVLGIVANGLGISEVMFDRLGELLRESDGLAGVVKVVKPSVAVPPWPEQWAEIIEHATVAVTGFGGCGSCSTRSIRDALDLEAIGIPSVCVGHTAAAARGRSAGASRRCRRLPDDRHRLPGQPHRVSG